MVYCPECGTQLQDGDRFCPSCGADVDRSHQSGHHERQESLGHSTRGGHHTSQPGPQSGPAPRECGPRQQRQHQERSSTQRGQHSQHGQRRQQGQQPQHGQHAQQGQPPQHGQRRQQGRGRARNRYQLQRAQRRTERSPGLLLPGVAGIAGLLALEGFVEVFFTRAAMEFYGVYSGSVGFWRVTGGLGLLLGVGVIASVVYFYQQGQVPRWYFAVLVVGGIVGIIPLGMVSVILFVPAGLYGVLTASP